MRPEERPPTGSCAAVAAVRFPRPFAPEAAAGADSRADELRAKLDEARREPAAEPEPADEAPAGPDASPEERRRRVHEQGRAALDEMQPE